MNTIEYFKEHFEQLQSGKNSNGLGVLRQKAFNAFAQMGIPAVNHEEWKYTRIGSLFNTEYLFPVTGPSVSAAVNLDAVRLPGYQSANEVVFLNGLFSPELSVIRSPELVILPLEKAMHEGFGKIIEENFGHSGLYLKDGIHALNSAFVQGAVFIHIKKGKITEHPLYIYHLTDARAGNILSQPRSLVHVAENAQVQLVENYATLGAADCFINQVMEVIVEKEAQVEYYKIQNDAHRSSQVSTTHFRQTGKSYVHAVTISLNGSIVRNNLNVVLDAEYCETHLYGLYYPSGKGHIDNHTVVDNVKPNCFSNEFYKGLMDGQATGVFNGKIFVRPQAQKTNAYQSNKNILLSDTASVNTKPQLEIFADDVKCSHGCTIGKLDEEGLFYLRSRGISEKTARALLLHAFVIDILEHIKPEPIRTYVDELISDRLEYNIA